MNAALVRRAARRALFVAPLLLLLASAPATATVDRTEAKAGKLSFAGTVGGALPYRHGVVVVHVGCAGAQKSRCTGTVLLLARGGKAQRLVGTAPLARRTVKIKGRNRAAIRLRLGARARSAAVKGVLAVSVELRSKGGKLTRARTSVSEAQAIMAGSKPDHVRIDHPLQGGGNTATLKTYSWEWRVTAGHYLVLPAFHCPDDAPLVAANGTEIHQEGFWDGMQGVVTASGDDGIGYGHGFTVDHKTRNTPNWLTVKVSIFQVDQTFNLYQVMTGWPEGDWLENSVWASPFYGGNFRLSVTCTDQTSIRQIAWALQQYIIDSHTQYFVPTWKMVSFAWV